MKLITGTQEQITTEENRQFQLGGPFRAYTYRQTWDEESGKYYSDARHRGGVDHLQRIKPTFPGSSNYFIVHIDSIATSAKTFGEYLAEIHGLSAEDFAALDAEALAALPQDELDAVGLAISARCQLDQLELTPAQYVAQTIPADLIIINV